MTVSFNPRPTANEDPYLTTINAYFDSVEGNIKKAVVVRETLPSDVDINTIGGAANVGFWRISAGTQNLPFTTTATEELLLQVVRVEAVGAEIQVLYGRNRMAYRKGTNGASRWSPWVIPMVQSDLESISNTISTDAAAFIPNNGTLFVISNDSVETTFDTDPFQNGFSEFYNPNVFKYSTLNNGYLLVNNANLRGGVKWDMFDATENVEVEVTFRPNFIANSALYGVGPVARIQNTVEQRTMVAAHFYRNANTTPMFRVYQLSNASDTLIGEMPIPGLSANENLNLKLKVEGEKVYGKFWREGFSEPDWLITGTTTVLGEGNVGVYGRGQGGHLRRMAVKRV